MLDKQGYFHLFEVKSSHEDFRVDRKRRDYMVFCDTFSSVVATDFPQDLIPAEVGLLICDAYDGQKARLAYQIQLYASRRKAMTLLFAHLAAVRLTRMTLT